MEQPPLSIVDETIQSITIGVIVSNTGYSKLAPTNSWVAISSVSGRYTLEGFNTLRGNPVEAATTSDVRSQSVNSLITKAHCQLILSPGLR